jgi:hypothetical protein
VQSLSPDMILNAWEQGSGLHPIDQALLVLSFSCPEQSRETLADLNLGYRDILLLELHRRTFGDQLEAYTECPECREPLEFSLSCDHFLSGVAQRESAPKTLTIQDAVFTLRAPNSRDAAAAAASESLTAAKNELLTRCATPAAGSNPIESLQEPMQSAIAAELAAIDSHAEMLLNLTCPACGHLWRALFEIMTFLWTEIRARARRLLQEVDALARAYGWSEADILAMSDARRALYVQMAVA